MTDLPAPGTRFAPRTALTLAVLALAFALLPTADADDDTTTVPIDRWLVAGPVASPAPAFADQPAFTGGSPADRREVLEAEALLPEWPLDAGAAWPAAGAAMGRPDGGEESWSARSGESLDLGAAGDGGRLAWLATFVEVDRFVEAKLVVESEGLLRVFVDGEQVAEEGSADSAEAEETGNAEADLELVAGKHLLLIAALAPAEAEEEGAHGWSLAARLEVPEGTAVTVSDEPRRGVTVRDLLDPPQVSAVELSADGSLAAVTLDQPAVPSEDRTSWVEIYATADGSAVRTLRQPSSISGFAWAPAGRGFAFRSGGALWVGDLDGGRLGVLLERDGLGGVRWAADGRSLFVGITEEEEADDRGVVRLRSLPDRWGGHRDVGSLYQLSADDGRRLRRLTAGPSSVSLEDVSPDGRKLLVSRTRYTLERPFAVGELVEIDLATLATTTVAEVGWLGSAAYSPDGERLLVVAGPSTFGGAGHTLAGGAIPNEYDGQAYVVDRGSGEVTASTRGFAPAVDGAAWSRHDGAVYLRVTEGEYGRLYRWQPAAASLRRLESGDVDVVAGFALARGGPEIVAHGSGLQRPSAAFVLSTPEAVPRPLAEPAADDYAQVAFGRVDDFAFAAADGSEIPGRLYYPLDFDPRRRYPLIVYYYGGVVPTDRSFAGRYPKNLWAARGYAVYVLQPSGTVGYGDEYAARHVNDWGERVVGEILAGVDAVVAAHPFLDGTKVGCFGGSYGGFTTMRLVTSSDRFAAAISHAGISGIASYWGEGWWGYLYMAAAAAESYPWNRPDLYVDRSPLFAADRVTTPLLLLHGTADPNVPPGESEQMFAALRLLGKEVEYVRIEGEAHWILDYPKRVLWWETILAWFDKHLKDDPAAWEHLWGEELERTGP